MASLGLCSTYEANGVNPEDYLADVLMCVGDHPASDIDARRPHRWQPRAAA